MDAKLVELYLKRGRLHERIGAQRVQLTVELAPLGNALRAVDRTHALFDQARVWMLSHPGVLAVAGLVVVIWRPRTLWRSARLGFVVWRNWGRWRHWMRAGLSIL